jgi:LuxR family maltose regulon positive regulatory protein
VERSDLVGELDGFAGRVIVITAPAGYGKSTLAAQWCRRSERPVIWMSADGGGDDPIAIATRLLSSLHAVEPLDADARTVVLGGPARFEHHLLPTLRRCLVERAPLIVCVDDADHLRSTGSRSILTMMVASMPPGSSLVLTGRQTPEIGVERLRPTGEILEIGLDRLALNGDEAAEVLALMGWELDQVQVDSLVDATEGWPAGIGLAGVHDAAFERIVEGGSARLPYEFVEYFGAAMEALDDDLRQFLRRTAVLDRFSGALCGVALAIDDAETMVRELARCNLFVVPLDPGHEWFRFHSLFAELLAQPPWAIEPAERSTIQRRAARWLDEHDDAERAIVAAHHSGDVELLGEISLRHAEKFLSTGRVHQLGNVFDLVDHDDMGRCPTLALAAAHVYSRIGRVDAARRLVDAARFSIGAEAGPGPDGTASLETAYLVARYSVWADDATAMVDAGVRILELEAGGSTKWQLSGHRIAGCGLLVQGRHADAVEHFARSASLARSRGDVPGRIALNDGLLMCALLEIGRVADADRLWRGIADTIEVQRALFPIECLWTYLGEALLAIRRGDEERALMATQALETHLRSIENNPLLLADLAVRAGEVSHAAGDADIAGRLAGLCEARLGRVTDSGTTAGRLRSLQSALDVSAAILDALTPTERRVLEQLETHRTLEEIGAHLYVSRATVKTHVSSIYAKLGVGGRSGAVDRLQASRSRPIRPMTNPDTRPTVPG